MHMVALLMSSHNRYLLVPTSVHLGEFIFQELHHGNTSSCMQDSTDDSRQILAAHKIQRVIEEEGCMQVVHSGFREKRLGIRLMTVERFLSSLFTRKETFQPSSSSDKRIPSRSEFFVWFSNFIWTWNPSSSITLCVRRPHISPVTRSTQVTN